MNNLASSLTPEEGKYKKIKDYYDFRIKSFLVGLTQDEQLKLPNNIVQNNQNIGNIITQNNILQGDLDTTLQSHGYELFGSISMSEFYQQLDKNSQLIHVILEGKILIGFENDFNKIITTSISYEHKEVIHHYIN